MSKPLCSMYGFRSCHAPDSQNCPTLSSVNDSTTSGGLPLLIEAMIFWSFTPPVLFTVIHGYCSVKPSKIWLNCFSSRPVHAPQISSVTGSFEAALAVSTGEGASSPPPLAVHAAAINANVATTTINGRFIPYPPSRSRGSGSLPARTTGRDLEDRSRRHLPPGEQLLLGRLQRHRDRPVEGRLLAQDRGLDPRMERRDRLQASVDGLEQQVAVRA